ILAIAFSYQIYCDFSAYCDIARGVAKLFSIKLSRNFLNPLLITNPSDLFKKWNITLSNWVRDYIYIPMGGSRCSLVRNIFNLYFTMFIIGAWHGAGIFYILYGLFFSTLVIIYKIIPLHKILPFILGKKIGNFFSITIMFFLISYGMMIFWSKTLNDFIDISSSFLQIKEIIFLKNSPTPEFIKLLYGLLIFVLPILVTDIIGYRRNREFVDLYPKFRGFVKISLFVSMFYLTLFLASRGSYNFIYFQF
ncbi:MAG: hypothetical protein LW595_04635, partial [Rickettsiales bacterium]|nr:hypothetical protein [Rickettsiales bacterium]